MTELQIALAVVVVNAVVLTSVFFLAYRFNKSVRKSRGQSPELTLGGK